MIHHQIRPATPERPAHRATPGHTAPSRRVVAPAGLAPAPRVRRRRPFTSVDSRVPAAWRSGRASVLTFLLFAFGTTLSLGLKGERDERNSHPERGDVPGWVMVTLMTAALVALLLAVAGPALEGLFRQAIDTVTRK